MEATKQKSQHRAYENNRSYDRAQSEERRKEKGLLTHIQIGILTSQGGQNFYSQLIYKVSGSFSQNANRKKIAVKGTFDLLTKESRKMQEKSLFSFNLHTLFSSLLPSL